MEVPPEKEMGFELQPYYTIFQFQTQPWRSAIPNLELKNPKTTNPATDFTDAHGFFLTNPCKSA
jgi:hypothetical protein